MNLVTAKQIISNQMDIDDFNQIKSQMIERAVRHLFDQITVTNHGAFDPVTQTHYLMISLKLNNQIR